MSKKLPIVAIVGRANVGKSSLFNRLVGKRQAIVSDIAGTTRDRVVAKVGIDDKLAYIVDTAGLKRPEDGLELGIQEQITQATDSATVILVVVEGDIGLTQEDRDIAKRALKTKKPVILVLNKMDRAKHSDLEVFKKLGIRRIQQVSAEHATGLDELAVDIAADLPLVEDEDNDTLKIAFVGRPNVGKSKLFNNLASENRAVVSDVAGTTRDANRIEIKVDGNSVELIDTAGVRKSGKNTGIEYYSSLRTLISIDESDVCVLLMDAQEPSTKLDLKIAGMIKDAGKGLILALNKWDLVEKDDFTFDEMAPRVTRAFQFVAWAPLMVLSAEDGKNALKLISLAKDIAVMSTKKLGTSELNTWLLKAMSHHPPAGLKNTHPAPKYITQTGIKPPTFEVHGRHMKTLHWSYKRYLEREIREAFDITGTAIRFNFVESSERKV